VGASIRPQLITRASGELFDTLDDEPEETFSVVAGDEE